MCIRDSPYPEGDVVVTYDGAGTYPVRADVVYSGEFRVNGGTWIPIDGEVTVTGTTEDLAVREAKARLYTN